GPTGVTGPTGLGLQPFVDANINGQLINSNDPVIFPSDVSNLTIFGIDFNGTDTFTITNPGLYVLGVTLNYNPATGGNTVFAVSLNSTATIVAPAANAGTVGPISIIRIAMYTSGTAIQIRNRSTGQVTIKNGNDPTGNELLNSAGHIIFYRIADGPLS
ncbi:hypothetical protein BTW32_31305, partial [Bacillus thuringiensis]